MACDTSASSVRVLIEVGTELVGYVVLVGYSKRDGVPFFAFVVTILFWVVSTRVPLLYALLRMSGKMFRVRVREPNWGAFCRFRFLRRNIANLSCNRSSIGNL